MTAAADSRSCWSSQTIGCGLLPTALALLLFSGCGGDDLMINVPEGVVLRTGVTWYKDVLPIVQKNCQGCHVSGGIAPFPIVTYEEAELRHTPIAQTVLARTMPPWKPALDCQSFQDARTLTVDEISTIWSWAALGRKQGNPEDAPADPPPMRSLPPGYVTLEYPNPYTPNTAGSYDDYHCFILNPRIFMTQWLTGYNIVPGTADEVHHVTVYALTNSELSVANSMYSDPSGYSCFGGPMINGSTPRLVAAWAPGSGATLFPEGTGIRLDLGFAFVMQIHYNTGHNILGARPDSTKLQLQLSATPVARPANISILSQDRLHLDPMANGVTSSISLTATQAGTLWGVAPHMHLLGKKIKATLSIPGMSNPADSCLIDIPSWDFHWQQAYFYSNPNGIPIPNGATVNLTCTHDNTTGLPVNYGERSSDEMCLTMLYFTQ